jgi:hypothetical protein
MPRSWWFALISCMYSLGGFWGGAVIACLSVMWGVGSGALYFIVPIVFLAGQLFRSLLRQKMIGEILYEDKRRLKRAAMVDILGNFLWSWVLFFCIAASAFGRTICWRGVRYKIISPTDTEILN